MKGSRNHGTMSLTFTTERVTKEACYECARFDAHAMGEDAGKYAKANAYQYYACINVWILLIEDLADMRTSYAFLDYIRRRGFLATIVTAKEVSNAVIQALASSGSYNDILNITELFPSGIDISISDVLEILRFPKRFTPLNLNSLRVSSIAKFKDINRRCDEFNHRTLPYFLIDGIKRYLKEMLRGFKEVYRVTSPHFSSGTTTRGKTLSKKIHGYSEICHYFADPLYPIGDPLANQYDMRKYASSIRPVAKDSENYRIIAPEHPYYAAQKQRVKDAFRECLRANGFNSWYNPEDQDCNRVLAFTGSVTGEYATIDLTSASDSICEALVYYTMPDDVLPVLHELRTPFISVDKQIMRKRMFATSGDPMCFDVEAMVFLSLAFVASDICHSYTGDAYRDPVVFGDDIVVDSRLYETMIDFLTLLGCIPNERKSFATGFFRESCGVDYFCGMDITTTYWPRSAIKCDNKGILLPTSLASLVSLQHKVFKHYRAQLFLTNLIYESYPKLTSSCVGDECEDLWADVPVSQPRVAPHNGPRWAIDEVPDWAQREAHSAVCVDSHNHTQAQVDLDVEMYHYVQFLIHGPYYEDALSKLLNVSAPRSRATDFEIPEHVVKLITR